MTVLLPHNTVLSELYREQRIILAGLPENWRRFLPLGCFLPNTGESLESWKTRITECRILPPVMRENAVAYPVDIPGIPNLEIVTAVAIPGHTELPQISQFSGSAGQYSGDFRERSLRVFRLCEMTIAESEAQEENCSGTVSRWTIDGTVWVGLEKH